MEDNEASMMSDWLDVARAHLGRSSVDLELPDIIDNVDVTSQWEKFKPLLINALAADDFCPTGVEIVDLPKNRLTVRPLARLELKHRLVYESLVGAIASKVSKTVSRSVYSSRWWPAERRLVNPVGSWLKMQRAARYFHARHPDCLLAKTDISSFYENIDIDILVDDLRSLDVPHYARTALESFLVAFNKLSSAWGIPQGFDMSGILANLYLRALDAEMRHSGCRYLRYSDDIYIFASDWTTLREVLVTANRTLRHRHLNLAAAKTEIFQSSDVMSTLVDGEKDAVNYGLRAGWPNAVHDLREIFDSGVGVDPFDSRDIKFSLPRLAMQKDDHAVAWLLDNFAAIPHLSREATLYLDHFAGDRLEIESGIVALLGSKNIKAYPYVQQHLLVFMIRNLTKGQQPAELAYRILMDRNTETFVREMAARYLGLCGLPGEGGLLRKWYSEEENSRVRRALLVACYESRQCDPSWLQTVSLSDPVLRTTAEYLRSGPDYIPRPKVER